MQNNEYISIPKEKFEFAPVGEKIYDKKLETKPIGYFKDAWIRFRKNKSSVAAAIIIMILILFAIIVPIFSHYTVEHRDGYYKTVLPKFDLLAPLGIWDGTFTKTDTRAGYYYYNAIGVESGYKAVIGEPKITIDSEGNESYKFKADSYNMVGYVFLNLTSDEYFALQKYQDDNEIQVIYPMPENYKTNYTIGNAGANFWYKLKNNNATSSGEPLLDKNGDYIPNYIERSSKDSADYTSKMRIASDTGENGKWFAYAVKNQTGYKVRVLYREYYIYKNGFEPSFLFGTNAYGQDIFTCLAAGARLSFILAIFVSIINLTIGAFYGAVEGYYGGAVDMILERISDILASVPFIVVVTLFKLHLAEKVGALPSLLFAFVMTGWVGMASRVRLQFYRFKGHEYILAARTLGAKDGRLMFKHIFPNSIGTIITGAVLTIPGVIFSESSLSYLGIINLETSSLTSVGTMLAQGQGYLQTFPHIILFPAMFISLLEISFNLFGNGLRDAFNPSLRGVEE
ncbi:MAG: ABC transporter permease [Clostridia bacterium]|nr:ABC transporter permease [Clostridia bacterium]